MTFVRASRVPTVRQFQTAECGLASLSMLMGFHGCPVPLEELRRVSGLSGDGAALALLKRVAAHYGFHLRAYRKEPEALPALGFPCMVFVNFNHMLVVEDMANGMVRVNDPDGGRRSLSVAEFDRAFTGIALRLKPGPQVLARPPHRSAMLRKLAWSCAPWGLAVLVLALLCGGAEAMVATALEREPIWAVAALVAAILGRHALLWAAGGALRARAAAWVGDCLFSRSAGFFGYRGVTVMAYMARLPASLGQWVRGVAGATLASMVSGLVVLGVLAWLSPVAALASMAAWAILALANARVFLATDAARRCKPHQGQNLSLADVLTSPEPWQSAGRDQDILAAEASGALVTNQRAGVEDAALRAATVAALAATFAVAALAAPGLAAPALALLASRWWLDVPAAMPAFLTLRPMADALDDLAASPSHQPLQSATNPGSLAQLECVGFGHGARLLFQSVTLTVEAGAVIGLAGAGGSGKSTLARLLTGQLPATSGMVGLRGRAVLVPTAPVLFDASIADNVACWRPGIDPGRVEWALKVAGLWDDIAARPDGVNTLVEAESGNFSGGQQRRLMLARALADRPDLLVLDETLDAVDPATERRILANLREAGITVIIISQRRETFALCDRAWRLTADGCVPLTWDTEDATREAMATTEWEHSPDAAGIPPGTWAALTRAADSLGVTLPHTPPPVPCPPSQHPLHWQARLHGLLLLPVTLEESGWSRGGTVALLARWRDGGNAVLVPSALGGYRLWQGEHGWRRLSPAMAARLEPSALAVLRRGGGHALRSLWPDLVATLTGAVALWLGACALAGGVSPAALAAMAAGAGALTLARHRCRIRLGLIGTVESTAHILGLSAWWSRRQSEAHLQECGGGARTRKHESTAASLTLAGSGIGIAAVAAISGEAVITLAVAGAAALVSAILAWKPATAAERLRPHDIATRQHLHHLLTLMASITGTPLAQALRQRWSVLAHAATEAADRRDHWAACGQLWRLLAPVLSAILLPAAQAPVVVLAAWAGLSLGDGASALLRTWRMSRRLRPFLQAPREDTGPSPTQPPCGLAAKAVSFAYDCPLLTGLSLSVTPGEIVAIAGPSGCGKSTLLRLLLGSERPQGGRVLWDGQDLADGDRMAWRAHVAAVFQDEPMGLDLLHAHMRGRACMNLGRVVAALVAVGLWPKVASMPMGLAALVDSRMLSSGEMAQVQLARALAREPRMLFLDETLSALDTATQRRVLALIRARNITCILTSHQDAVLAQADRVLRLEDGELVEETRNRAAPPQPETDTAPLPAPFGEAARLYRPTVLARMAATQAEDMLPRPAPSPLPLALAALVAAAISLAG